MLKLMQTEMTLGEKLEILSDAAKYDVFMHIWRHRAQGETEKEWETAGKQEFVIVFRQTGGVFLF